MARIIWACWDGGGNLPPSMGIAEQLCRRGHQVAFYGRPEMVERVRPAGGEAHALTQARTDIERFSFHPLATVFGYTTSPAVGQELVDVVEREHPDVVVIDAMFAAALDRAPDFGTPTVVMVHTFARRQAEVWRATLAMQSDMRVRAGLEPIPPLEVLWGERSLVHVNTLAALDDAPDPIANLVHGAPVLTADHRARPAEVPWPADDPTPIVLLSFSTVPQQRDPDAIQRSLDGLADLPVHVLGTTAGVVDPADLTAPPNARLLDFVDHDQVLPRAAAVLGHGGHGTTMRALRAGVPLVVMPAKGADQAGNAAFVEESGLGHSLAQGSDAATIRAAVDDVLTDPRFRTAAGRTAALFEGMDGPALGADSVESVLA